MTDVNAEVTLIRPADGGLPYYQIDFDEPLITGSPFCATNLRPQADFFSGKSPVQRGHMLSQVLRYIRGIGTVDVSHYTATAQVGRKFTDEERIKTVRGHVRFVLQAAVPWCVYRNELYGSPWYLHTGVQLLGTDLSERMSEALSFPDARITKFDAFTAYLEARWRVSSTDDPNYERPPDWPSLDRRVSEAMHRITGTRNVTVNVS